MLTVWHLARIKGLFCPMHLNSVNLQVSTQNYLHTQYGPSQEAINPNTPLGFTTGHKGEGMHPGHLIEGTGLHMLLSYTVYIWLYNIIYIYVVIVWTHSYTTIFSSRRSNIPRPRPVSCTRLWAQRSLLGFTERWGTYLTPQRAVTPRRIEKQPQNWDFTQQK